MDAPKRHPTLPDFVFCPSCGRPMHEKAKTCGNYCDDVRRAVARVGIVEFSTRSIQGLWKHRNDPWLTPHGVREIIRFDILMLRKFRPRVKIS